MLHRILLASLLSLAPLAAAPTPDHKVTFKTVGDVTLQLHVFNPENHKATDKTPAIVFFFGGGWVGGSPSQFYPHCKHLAEKGMVAISAEYRVKKPHGTSPIECVKDGKSAIRWVRQHAAELGVDPNKIAAGGGSAGGHVKRPAPAATSTSTRASPTASSISPKPKASITKKPSPKWTSSSSPSTT